MNVVEEVLSRAVSLVKDQVSLVLGVDGEIKFLKKVLPKLDEAILNAEVTTEEMAELRAILHNFVEDAEDIVDEFDTVVAQRGLSPIKADRQRKGWLRRIEDWAGLLMGEQRANKLMKQVCGSVPSSFCFDPSDGESASLFFYTKIANQIKGLYGELERVKEYQERVGSFVDSAIRGLGAVREQRAEVDGLPRRPITDAVRGKDVELVGRERDKKEIMNMLLEGSFKPMVVLVTGMGGIGKTTLVQDIFSAPEVVNHFPVKKWVCVGDELDSKEAMRKIFGTEDREDICEKVRGKRFLIVLDDCWSGKLGHWNELWEPLTHGGEGSKAIITSRQDVGRELGAAVVECHVLGGLLEEECLQIFESYAFPGGVPSSSSGRDSSTSELQKIGRGIVHEKVGGVPLAARVLGSSLRGVNQVETWKAVLKAVAENNIMSALMWSYRRLPSHLKRCFSYLSLFPKDRKLEKMHVVYMWMACGYVSGNKYRLEHTGEGYFDALVSSSLLQPSVNDFRYVMHDLVHDLASSICRGDCFSNGEDESNDQIVSKKHMYTRKVRAFFWKNVDCPDQVQLIKYSRVLYFDRYLSRVHCPQISFSEVIHLRYLNFSRVVVSTTSLEVICGMYNLQTLVLYGIMENFPPIRWKLPNLRHLFGMNLRMDGIGNSESLQTVPTFHVFKDNDIEELENLKELRGDLNIKHLNNIRNSESASKARISDKEYVEKLILEWDEKYEEGRVDVMQNEIIENLRPHGNLRVLNIEHYRGDRSPNWMGWEHLSNLKRLILSKLPHLGDLPPLGHLPCLKVLQIEGLRNLRSIGTEFYGTKKDVFPSLESLTLEDIHALEEWKEYAFREDGTTNWFPSLERLYVRECKELRSLPHLPRRLKSLRIESTGLKVLPEIWSFSNDQDSRHLFFFFVREMHIRDCPLLCPDKWFRKYRMPSLAELYLSCIDRCINLFIYCSLKHLKSIHIEAMDALELVTLYSIFPSDDHPVDFAVELVDMKSMKRLFFMNNEYEGKNMTGRLLLRNRGCKYPISLLVESGYKFEPHGLSVESDGDFL